jgi:hypothetical protein
MRQNLRVVDTSSGEVLSSGVFVYVVGKVKTKERFFMGFQEAFAELAKDKELAGQPTRVFLYLLSVLDWENYVAVEQRAVGRELGIGETRVSESMRKLLAKGLLERGPKTSLVRSYRLNPHSVWRGSLKNLQEARRDHLRVAVDNSSRQP